MRLWQLDELAMKHFKVVHVCDACGINTPISPLLYARMDELSLRAPQTIYVKDNVCDDCNKKAWGHVVAHIENARGDL